MRVHHENKKASKTEALYKRLELKLNINQKQIRDQHKRFLKSHPKGEMTREDFIDFLQSEKKVKPYVAKSLFRSHFLSLNIPLMLYYEIFQFTPQSV